MAATAVLGLVLGPWLARVAARLAARDATVRPARAQAALLAVLLAALLAGVAVHTGWRPASVALAWACGAGLVLGAVDLAAHRLPDRVLAPAAAVCTAALVCDAAVEGSWAFLLNGVLAALASLAVAYGVALVSPRALGFGDVKLLGLLGLLLGWHGWGALVLGVFLGLVAGALASLALIAARRATWRTPVPFGPPLLVGAALAVALSPLPPM